MHVPSPESLSGKMDFVIKAYGWETDSVPDGTFCRQGTRVRVFLDIFLSRDPEGLIIGYQILNRLGMEVFGETSLHALSGDPEGAALCRAGSYRVAFSFTWPQIRDGDYFMTLGLGEGREVLRQTEQCWVNRAVHFQSDPGGEVIFGIFNRRMEDVTVRKEEEDVDFL
jgi:teichoic acid transport system ATP-binding protein